MAKKKVTKAEIKPMLAGKAELSKVKYPVLASPKLDGVRGLVDSAGVLRSRSWKVFPNNFVQQRFSKKEYYGLDGELILGLPTAKDVYRQTNGACQRFDGEPDVLFYVFDNFTKADMPYEARYHSLIDEFAKVENIIILKQKEIKSEKELLEYEEEVLALGYEGVMLRDVAGAYKFGRATTNGGELLKLKRFEDSEAEVIGYYEEMHNGNEATKNSFGRTERSSHKANLVGKERLGGLQVRDLKTKVEFDIGTGFDEAERIDLWASRDRLKGQIVKYKYFAVGVKDKPRHPVYLGPRSEWDL